MRFTSNKLYISIFLLLFLNVNAYAKSAGSTSFETLNIPIGSREIAMGAATAISSPENAFWWNPARLSYIERSSLSLMYNQWLLDITQQRVGFSFPMPRDASGAVNLYMLSIAGIEGYTWQDVATGDVNAKNFYGSYTQSKKFSNHFMAGLTLKGLVEQLDDESAFALAFDLGILVTPPLLRDILFISAGAKNIGDGSKFINIKEKLPMSFFAGAGLRMNKFILLSSDIYYLDNELRFALGGELNIWQILFFRAGWSNLADVDEKFRYGAGWKIDRFQVDYAYVPFSDLGTTQRLDIILAFGAPSTLEKMYKKGKKFYKKEDYDFAWIEFNKILALDPQYKKIKSWIDKTIDKIRAIERGELKPKSKEDKKKGKNKQDNSKENKQKKDEPVILENLPL